jgi:hypothetical protein
MTTYFLRPNLILSSRLRLGLPSGLPLRVYWTRSKIKVIQVIDFVNETQGSEQARVLDIVNFYTELSSQVTSESLFFNEISG